MSEVSSTEVDEPMDAPATGAGSEDQNTSSHGVMVSKSLAQKIDHLFRTVRPAGRGEYSYQDVTNAIRDKYGPVISGTYIWQLRKGQRDNPTKRHLEALAEFFGVPVSYFFEDGQATQNIKDQLAFIAALRDANVRHVALRAAGLSSESLASITAVIEQIRQLEGLADKKNSVPDPAGQ